MKKTLIILYLIITSCFAAEAQTFQPFQASNHIDYISVPVILGNSLYYFGTYNINNNTDTVRKSEHYITKINLTNFSTTIKPIVLDTNVITFIHRQPKAIGNKLYAFAGIGNDSKALFYGYDGIADMHMLELDTNLNVLKNILIANLSNLSGSLLFNIKDDTTIVASKQNFPPTNAQHFTIDTRTGNYNIFFNSTNDNVKSWSILSDSVNAYFNSQGKLYSFNEQYQLASSNTIVLLPTHYILNPRYVSKKRGQNKTLFKSMLRDQNFMGTHYSCMYEYDYISQQATIIDTQITTSQLNDMLVDIDVIDSTYIYSADMSNMCNVFNFSSISNCTNAIIVNKHDSVGNKIWSTTIGNDASYTGNSILATPDSGCLVFVTRYDSSINNYENDVYYIKLDKDGNQQLNYLPVSTPNIVKQQLAGVTLFPNPAQNTINFKYHTSDKIAIQLFSIDGKILSTKNGNFNKPIDVSYLRSGLYLYRITGPDGSRALGKFEKE